MTPHEKAGVAQKEDRRAIGHSLTRPEGKSLDNYIHTYLHHNFPKARLFSERRGDFLESAGQIPRDLYFRYVGTLGAGNMWTP